MQNGVEPPAMVNPQQPSNPKKGDKPNRNSEANGRCNGMKSFMNRTPKKVQQEKSNVSCATNMGAHT
jgi:hypothetical protein